MNISRTLFLVAAALMNATAPATAHAAGRWGARCGSARHRCAWLQSSTTNPSRQSVHASDMAASGDPRNRMTTLKALQLQGFRPSLLLWRSWNSRLTGRRLACVGAGDPGRGLAVPVQRVGSDAVGVRVAAGARVGGRGHGVACRGVEGARVAASRARFRARVRVRPQHRYRRGRRGGVLGATRCVRRAMGGRRGRRRTVARSSNGAPRRRATCVVPPDVRAVRARAGRVRRSVGDAEARGSSRRRTSRRCSRGWPRSGRQRCRRPRRGVRRRSFRSQNISGCIRGPPAGNRPPGSRTAPARITRSWSTREPGSVGAGTAGSTGGCST